VVVAYLKEYLGTCLEAPRKHHSLYSSSNIIKQIKSRRMRWAGYMARMGEERKVYKVLLEKPEGETTRKTRRRWEDGIRIDLGKIGWEE
jgi:hypothetical protein